MEDEENLVKLYSYFLNEEELIEMDKEGKTIDDEIIEKNGIQYILKDNLIWYKNKLVDYWNGRDYKIMVEIYVNDIDYERAKKVVNDFYKNLENAEFLYDECEGYEGYEEDIEDAEDYDEYSDEGNEED